VKLLFYLFLLFNIDLVVAGTLTEGGGGGSKSMKISHGDFSTFSDLAENNSFGGVIGQGGGGDTSNIYKPVAFGIRGTLGGEIEHVLNPIDEEFLFNRLMLARDEVLYDRLSSGSNWAK